MGESWLCPGPAERISWYSWRGEKAGMLGGHLCGTSPVRHLLLSLALWMGSSSCIPLSSFLFFFFFNNKNNQETLKSWQGKFLLGSNGFYTRHTWYIKAPLLQFLIFKRIVFSETVHTVTNQGSWPSPINRNWSEVRQKIQVRLYWGPWCTVGSQNKQQVCLLALRWGGRACSLHGVRVGVCPGVRPEGSLGGLHTP